MQRMPGREGLRALVTGGTSRLGEAVVARLVRDRAAVAFTGLDARRGSEVAARSGGVFVAPNGTDEEEVRRAVTASSDTLGGLDALVCCPDEALGAPLSETSLEHWQRGLDANLTAPYLYSSACLPLLRAAGGGSIVHVASDVGIWGNARIGAYAVSSAALITLAQMLAVEAGPSGITVNAVCPGTTGRTVAAGAGGPDGEGGSDPEGRLIPPIGRPITTEEIAGVVAFLIGPEARSVSGAALLVDGGMRAGYRAWTGVT